MNLQKMVDKQLSVQDDTIYDIKKLGDHNMVLCAKETNGDDFKEVKLTLTR